MFFLYWQLTREWHPKANIWIHLCLNIVIFRFNAFIDLVAKEFDFFCIAGTLTASLLLSSNMYKISRISCLIPDNCCSRLCEFLFLGLSKLLIQYRYVLLFMFIISPFLFLSKSTEYFLPPFLWPSCINKLEFWRQALVPNGLKVNWTKIESVKWKCSRLGRVWSNQNWKCISSSVW